MIWHTPKIIKNLRPALPDEAGLFYSELEPEKDKALITVGHIRLDYGHGGKEF